MTTTKLLLPTFIAETVAMVSKMPTPTTKLSPQEMTTSRARNA